MGRPRRTVEAAIENTRGLANKLPGKWGHCAACHAQGLMEALATVAEAADLLVNGPYHEWQVTAHEQECERRLLLGIALAKLAEVGA